MAVIASPVFASLLAIVLATGAPQSEHCSGAGGDEVCTPGTALLQSASARVAAEAPGENPTPDGQKEEAVAPKAPSNAQAQDAKPAPMAAVQGQVSTAAAEEQQPGQTQPQQQQQQQVQPQAQQPAPLQQQGATQPGMPDVNYGTPPQEAVQAQQTQWAPHMTSEAAAGQIAPFGREDTAQELQNHAARTQDTLVDAVENAEVAEVKRAVFRALTRLRAAEIKEFDTIARLETQAIDEYNDNHHYREENPLQYIHSDEPVVPEDKYTSFHDERAS